MNEIITAPGPAVERRCRIEHVFDPALIELLRLVPRNPLLRALVLRLTGKLPPQECATFEQLKDWVETHCERKPASVSTNGRRGRDDGIAITVEFSETEYGRADYSVRRHGSGEFRVGAEDLMEIVRDTIEDGGGIDEIVEVIAGKIDDDAWNDVEPDMDEYDEYDYDAHDLNDTGNGETEFSRAGIRNAVLAFVRERHPELAAEL